MNDQCGPFNVLRIIRLSSSAMTGVTSRLMTFRRYSLCAAVNNSSFLNFAPQYGQCSSFLMSSLWILKYFPHSDEAQDRPRKPSSNRNGTERRNSFGMAKATRGRGYLTPKVKLQARYNRCGEAASELCLSASTSVRQLRGYRPGT